MQETHINQTVVETRKEYTWYYAGNNEKGEEGNNFAGVGFIIKNLLINYIKDIKPINDRIIVITMGYAMPLTIICVYIPTAEHSEEEKDTIYEQIEEEDNKRASKGPTIIAGGVNAIIQIKANEEEKCIGEHTFYKAYTTLEEQTEDVAYSRQKLIELCTNIEGIIMNTTFQNKAIQNLLHMDI